WLGNPREYRFFLLTGEAGSGKTAIASRLCQFSQGKVAQPSGLFQLKAGLLSAVHFCSARDQRRGDPPILPQSLSLQLAGRYPRFARVLAEQEGQRQVRITVEQRVQDGPGGESIGVVIKDLSIGSGFLEQAFAMVVRKPLDEHYKETTNEDIV